MVLSQRHIVQAARSAAGVLCCAWFLAGCATAPEMVPSAPAAAGEGIYHRVEKGQTLWMISKMYRMDLDELARVNRITDTAKVEVGQQIFVPFTKKVCPVPKSAVAGDFIWPLKGRVLTEFGETRGAMVNKGLNIRPASGSGDVVAARSGRVVFCAADFEIYGKTVIIDHGDGFFTVYARNAELFVQLGRRVEQGEVIARTGYAGRDREIYLHFQIRKGHVPQNPYFYLP